MSRKPIKRTDLDKTWIQPRKDRKIIVAPEYYLIICEGTKTEPNYFLEIKNIIDKNYKGKIELQIQGKAVGTMKLLKEAEKLAKSNLNNIKHVWVIYDKDDFSKSSFDNVQNKCNELNKNSSITYHPIWSNQCIELWFLLHFMTLQTDIPRKEYIKKLNENYKINGLGIYKKNNKDTFEKLRKFLPNAIKNAKILEESHEMKIPSKMAPSTKVYELIEKLYPYLK